MQSPPRRQRREGQCSRSRPRSQAAYPRERGVSTTRRAQHSPAVCPVTLSWRWRSPPSCWRCGPPSAPQERSDFQLLIQVIRGRRIEGRFPSWTHQPAYSTGMLAKSGEVTCNVRVTSSIESYINHCNAADGAFYLVLGVRCEPKTWRKTLSLAIVSLQSALVVGELRVVLRRVAALDFSVRAASSRAPISSNAAAGPFQRNSSTFSNKRRSVRSVASLRKSTASSRSRFRVSASALPFAMFTCHSRHSGGIDSRCRNLPRTAADDLVPQPRRPGYPSAESPTSAR